MKTHGGCCHSLVYTAFFPDNISPGNSYPFFNTQPRGDWENDSEGNALAVPA